MMGRRRGQLVVRAGTLAVVACAALVAAAVGTSATPGNFVPSAFGSGQTGANKWLPLKPGLQVISRGGVSRGSRRLEHIRVQTVTDVSKRINGVRAVIVLDQDFDGGQIAEQALDYLAEDKQGNVWYLGSYTESYEGGQFVNASDARLAGIKARSRAS
jgi:hypothetical protein